MKGKCYKCYLIRDIKAYGMCSACYSKTWNRKNEILFELKLGNIHFIIQKRFKNKKAYMKKYMKKNREKINAYNKYRYHNNINGSRDKHLAREKARKK